MQPIPRKTIVFLLGAMTLWSAGLAWGKTMSVQVKEAAVRETPSFVGKVVGTLGYGDAVEVQETQGLWSKVSLAGGTTGWLHGSALTSKRIALKAGQENARVAASSDELALAGKGFNSDVEGQFKKAHRDIDFSGVDRMEKIKISGSEMQSFLQEGGVAAPQGGAQ